MDTTPSTPSVTLPLKILSQLLFGFETLEDIKPRSLSPGDYARVKVIPVELGELILKLDPGESLFHIETITNNDDPLNLITHCELWNSFEWVQSNAKRDKSRAGAAIRIAQHEQSKQQARRRAELIEAIEDHLEINYKDRFVLDARRKFARRITDNYKQHNLSAIIETLGLLDTIQEHEEANVNINGTETT